mmetsp:Transcript_8677/g.15722  ORF Transcript_8677/g.15722 Transcript_8677/m.15722 type:complete len:122 (-) Transcript_8677:59-424(-)
MRDEKPLMPSPSEILQASLERRRIERDGKQLSSRLQETKSNKDGAHKNLSDAKVTIPVSEVESSTQSKRNPKSAAPVDMNDPLAFWSAWSTRRHEECLERDDPNKTSSSGCQCFEGLGSVM